MSRKRKASEQVQDISHAAPAAPLSAFAAARARRLRGAINGAQETHDSERSVQVEVIGHATSDQLDQKSEKVEAAANILPFNAPTGHSTAWPDELEIDEGDDDGHAVAAYNTESSDESEYEDADPSLDFEAREASHCWDFGSWKRTKANVISESESEISFFMKQNETVCISGCYQLKVSSGTIALCGAILRAAPTLHPVFAPITHSLPTLQCLSPQGATLTVCSLDHRGQDLERLSPLFNRIWNPKIAHSALAQSPGLTFSILNNTERDFLSRHAAPLIHLPEWLALLRNAAASQVPASIALIGPKRSGKSTLAQMLVNRFLTASAERQPEPVYLIQADPTKPLQGLAGTIALYECSVPEFGHSYTYSDLPGLTMIHAHVFPQDGHSSFFDYFVECLVDVFKRYEKITEVQAGHLIIDMPYWFLSSTQMHDSKVLRRIRLTHVVTLAPSPPTPQILELEEIAHQISARLSVIESQPVPSVSRTDAELVQMAALSQFHTETQSPGVLIPKGISISHTSPIVVSYGINDPGFIGFLPLVDSASSVSMFTLIEGSIIHIVQTEDSKHIAQFKRIPVTEGNVLPCLDLANQDKGLPLNPMTSSFVCSALVRAIDVGTQSLHLLIPPAERHKLLGIEPQNTIFVAGCTSTPAWAYLEDCYDSDYTADSRNAESKSATPLHEGLPEGMNKDKAPVPWVMSGLEIEKWGGINFTRRVRRFKA